MEYNVTRVEPYQEFECYEFEFEGHLARIVKPNVEPNGRWSLKTEYFSAFPTLELELLNRGWHLAYIKNDNRWAEPEDVARKVRFAEFVAVEFGLNKKCAIVGMSCGGLYGTRVAMAAPHIISALYLDAPVLNLLSCPSAFGDAEISLLDEYTTATGRTASDMTYYRESPIDQMSILLENNIPIIIVAGDSDEVVPYHENGAILEKFYNDNGGTIEAHIKKGCKHHPHGLEDTSIVADFLEQF